MMTGLKGFIKLASEKGFKGISIDCDASNQQVYKDVMNIIIDIQVENSIFEKGIIEIVEGLNNEKIQNLEHKSLILCDAAKLSANNAIDLVVLLDNNSVLPKESVVIVTNSGLIENTALIDRLVPYKEVYVSK